jgi:Sec-independent protein translocase protein TatA
MELFGIGTTELIAILLIMLVVAGPKRMLQWAYILGQYTSKLRQMWAETMTVLQKEFDQAGLDVTLPRNIPNRNSLVNQMNNALSGITKPVQDVLDEVKTDVHDAEAILTSAQKVE